MFRYLVFIVFITIISIFAGKLVATTGNISVVVIAVGLIVFWLSFFKRRVALAIIALSILLSPEIPLATIDVQRKLVLRIEDFIIITSFFAWLASVAVNKELYLFRYSPLSRPMSLYIFGFILSTFVAGLFWPSGYFNFFKAIFYILKYIEFFMIFFMFYNTVETEREVRLYFTFFLIAGIAAALYGISQIGREVRVYAPFDYGEANTFGGFLDMYMAFGFSFFLHATESRLRFWFGFLTLLFFVPMLHTLSRSSYLSFLVMYIYLLFRTKKGKHILLMLLAIAVLITPIVFPQKIFDRIRYTFTGKSIPEENIFVPTLDQSSEARIQKSMAVLKMWVRHPIFGYGITGVGFIDNQYVRVLGEGGLITFVAFIWLLTRIWRSIKAVEQRPDLSPFMENFAFAMELVFVVIVTHAITANSFIIVRIQENFWLLMGLLMSQYPRQEEEIYYADRRLLNTESQ